MGLLAGCMDRSISGPQAGAVGPTAVMMVPQGAPALGLLGGNNSDDASSDFTYNSSWGGVLYVGGQLVVLPDHSVCDPAKSSYGPGTWDSPCTPLNGTLKIHAEVKTANGRTWVDFTPALRFVPSKNESDWVMIYMSTPSARNSKDLSKFNILYSSAIGSLGIDETVQDASLRTYVYKSAGISYRRIKHFSGYNVSAGFWDPNCEAGPDGNCIDDGSGIGGGGR